MANSTQKGITKAREPLFHIVKRSTIPLWKSWMIRIIAILAAFLVCGIITFLLSAATLVAFYVPDIHLIYDPSAIAIYVFMTVKMVNYVPKKISRIRQDYVEEEEEEKREEKEHNHDLKTKLDPIVNEWVQNKGFLHANISIKHVALEMGTNQNYLSRYINSVHEKTFSVWINTLRIEESKKILTENTSLSVEEVGQRVGIPHIYNFSRWFKTITGETPVQYRKSNSNR